MKAKCSKCGVEKDLAVGRIPKGWKRLSDENFCPGCWSEKFFLRSIALPVAGPLNIDWPEFRGLLRKSWDQSTALANWTVATLSKTDVVRTPEMVKLPKASSTYLYPLARAFMPDCPSQSLNSIVRAAEAKYRATRFEAVWSRSISLPSFKYPVPFPIPANSWSARYLSESERAPILRARLFDTLVDLRLRGGPEFRRFLSAFDQLVEGQAVGCEASIYPVIAHATDHRMGMRFRKPGGGFRFNARIMVRIVMWLPKPERLSKGEKTMVLVTSNDCFWAAHIDGRAPWEVKADHVRRWISEHAAFLQRISDDAKVDLRNAPQKARQMKDAVAIRCRKQRNRLHSFCHDVAAGAVSFALKNSVSKIHFDGSCKDYLPSFPWFKLRQLLGEKCAAANLQIEDVHDSGEASEAWTEAASETSAR